MQGNAAHDETAQQMLLAAANAIKALLPDDWDVASSAREDQASDLSYDATITVRAPDGQIATFLTEVKARPMAGTEQLLWRLNRIGLDTNREVLLVAPY